MNIDKQFRAYSVPKKIELPTIEHPIETEFLIPEYCPDILKILKCDVKNMITGKKQTENSLEIDCCSEITVLFCGSNNVVSSATTKYNFTKKIENKQLGNNDVEIIITKNYLNCRQTSSRRIDIKGSNNINVVINSFDALDLICDIQRDDIELLRYEKEITSDICTKEKQILIEEELLLSSSNKDINYILRKDVVTNIIECKIIGEKAIVKGNLKIDILYCSIEDKPELFSEIIPFSQIIEINTKDLNCNIIPHVSIAFLDIKPILNTNSNAGFLVSCGLNCKLKLTSNINVSIISDCYSTKVKVEATKEKTLFNKLIENYNEKVVVRKSFNLNDSQISSIVSLWCDEHNIDAVFKDNDLNFSGSIDCSVLYRTLEDIPEVASIKVDFNTTKKLNSSENIVVLNSKYNISSCSYTLISESQIELQIELFISADIYENIENECLKEIIDLEEKLDCDESIIIYYSSEDENAWEVAKRFNTPLQIFKDQNNLTEDTINSQSVLVISRM